MEGYVPMVLDCTVTAVHAGDRVIDVKSTGGRRFERISYMCPWISAIGSGWDFVPQVNDVCKVLAPKGRDGDPMIIGFKVPLLDGGAGQELGGRQPDFAEGDIGFRAIAEDGSEAKVLVRKGGVLVLGSGTMALSVYLPTGMMRHLFNDFEMIGPGGHVKWNRETGSNKVTYSAEYRTRVDPVDPGFRVNLDIADGDTPVRLRVTRIDKDPIPCLELSVDSAGVAHLKGNVIEVEALAAFKVKAPRILFNGRLVKPTGDPI